MVQVPSGWPWLTLTVVKCWWTIGDFPVSTTIWKRCAKDMGVSKNRGNPKSSILIGFSFINYKPSILGYHWVPLWLETSIWKRCGIIIITHDPLIVSSQLLGSQTIWVTAHLTKFIPWRSWGWREQKTPGGRMLKFLEMRRVKRCAKSGMRRRWFRFLSQAGFGNWG